MKHRLILIFIIAIIVTACKTNKESYNNDSYYLDDKGNTVTVKGSGGAIDLSKNSSSKFIFNGKNNEIIIEYFNAFFNSSNNRSVIIINGNDNKILISHYGTIKNSTNRCDTLIIEGDMNTIDFINKFCIDNSKNENSKNVFEGNNEIKIINNYKTYHITDSSEVLNKITKQWVYLIDAYDYYLTEMLKGNKDATFYLGEFYYQGIGTEINLSTAVYYFTIAASNGQVSAQYTLGGIYERDYYDIGFDKEKAIFWYKEAAKNGHKEAAKRLLYLENE
jgi:Sel1 repeat